MPVLFYQLTKEDGKYAAVSYILQIAGVALLYYFDLLHFFTLPVHCIICLNLTNFPVGKR